MTNNSDFYFPMSSSSSSPPPNPLKLRKKRSKFINIPNPKNYTKKPLTPPNSQFHDHHHNHCCPECFKLFGSQKALYGHMRCHPDRDYRGMIPIHRNPKFPISTPPSSSSSPLIRHQSTSTAMSLEDHEVAACLLLLSRTAILETDTDFECSSCKKVFGSHQALGGHRASHKNVKGCFAINRSCQIFGNNHDNVVSVVDDENKEDMVMANLGHKCSICLRVFPTGQALGGHKRCHWDHKGDHHDTNSSSPLMMINNGNCGVMDLNLPAAAADDDSSSSYSSAANFNLDLRLGL